MNFLLADVTELSTLALAVATVVLAVATVVLAVKTHAAVEVARRSAEASEKAVREALRPVVVPIELYQNGEGWWALLENVGPGPALNIFVGIVAGPPGQGVTTIGRPHIRSLASGETERALMIPMNGPPPSPDDPPPFGISIRCEDVAGTEFETVSQRTNANEWALVIHQQLR